MEAYDFRKIAERSFLNMQKRGIGPKSAFHHLEQDFIARNIQHISKNTL